MFKGAKLEIGNVRGVTITRKPLAGTGVSKGQEGVYITIVSKDDEEFIIVLKNTSDILFYGDKPKERIAHEVNV